MPSQIRDSAAMFCLGGWYMNAQGGGIAPNFKLQTIQELGKPQDLGLAKCKPNRISRSVRMPVVNIVNETSRGIVLRRAQVATTPGRDVSSRRGLQLMVMLVRCGFVTKSYASGLDPP
jgi:hypothetical protein